MGGAIFLPIIFVSLSLLIWVGSTLLLFEINYIYIGTIPIVIDLTISLELPIPIDQPCIGRSLHTMTYWLAKKIVFEGSVWLKHNDQPICPLLGESKFKFGPQWAIPDLFFYIFFVFLQTVNCIILYKSINDWIRTRVSEASLLSTVPQQTSAQPRWTFSLKVWY